MNDKLVAVFEGILKPDVLECVKNNYEKVADVNINQLGVDSLEVIKILFNIEEILQIEVDYEKFQLKWIETPRKISRILENGKILDEKECD